MNSVTVYVTQRFMTEGEWMQVGKWNLHLSETKPCSRFLRNVFYRATLCVSAVFAVARCRSLRPSVCLSVTLVYCIQTAEDIVKLLSRTGSPVILFFFDPQRQYPIPRGTPSAGAQNTRDGKILRFSTEIAVYLGNGKR